MSFDNHRSLTRVIRPSLLCFVSIWSPLCITFRCLFWVCFRDNGIQDILVRHKPNCFVLFFLFSFVSICCDSVIVCFSPFLRFFERTDCPPPHHCLWLRAFCSSRLSTLWTISFSVISVSFFFFCFYDVYSLPHWLLLNETRHYPSPLAPRVKLSILMFCIPHQQQRLPVLLALFRWFCFVCRWFSCSFYGRQFVCGSWSVRTNIAEVHGSLIQLSTGAGVAPTTATCPVFPCIYIGSVIQSREQPP